MTKFDAILYLNELYIRSDITDEYGDMEDMEPYKEAVDMAIKSLRGEDLNKIITEIEGANCKVLNGYDLGRNYGLFIAKQIIEKYMREGEYN